MLKLIKHTCIASLIVAPLILLAQDAALAVGFTATCRGITIGRPLPDKGSLYLKAICKTSTRGESIHVISLSRIIANDDGKLAWRYNGGFSASCKDFKVYHNLLYTETYLSASCPKIDGSYHEVNIHLDERINNINGRLRHHDIPGYNYRN